MDASESVRARTPYAEASAVIDSMAIGFVTVDRQWRITQVNAAAETVLGESAAVLVGRDLWQQYPGARELEFGRVFELVMTTRQPQSFDAYYPGLGIWFELRVQPAPDGIACYFLDITARKAADLRAEESVERTRLVAEVTESLGATLDIRANVTRLAQLVVPYLGSWSIVTLADDDGELSDEGWWHIDPARREDVRRYVEVRLGALHGTLAEEAVLTRTPTVLKSGAHALIRQRLTDPVARERLDALAPEAAAVVPMVARGRTVGLLTIYSDAAWTDHEFDIAKDIGGRAALSLDNSLAYERARLARAEAEAARADAEAAGRRLALLARVSEALAASDDADEAVGRLARLVVPQLADWSLVTVVDEDRGLRDIGVAHRDPAREREVAAYAARRSLAMAPDAPLNTAVRTGQPVVVADLSDQRLTEAQPDPVMARLVRGLEPHGVAVLPLIARGRVHGAITLVTTHERGSHTEQELLTAAEVAQRAGPVLDSARSAARARTLAESVQRSVLAVSSTAPALEIRTRYRPAQVDNEVGGDWYDHFDLPDGSTVLSMGDVMGHDTAAIAAMAQLRTFIRATAWTGRHSPAEVLADTDSASRTLGPGTFATAITGELDPPGPDGSVVLRWSNAGHLPPAVVSVDGAVEYLRPGAPDVPLGVIADATRRDHRAVLPPGSTLLLYTDGLVERRGHDIDEGLDRLRVLLAAGPRDDLDATLDRVLADMATGDLFGDDIALLAVRIRDLHADAAPPSVDRHLIALPPDTTASPVARAKLAVHTVDLPADVAADAALLASELMSNALRHGSAPFTLEVERTAGTLRVGVSDLGPGRPALPTRRPAADQPSGRGLLIIDAVADTWGVTASGTDAGKTVWFTLRTR